MQSSSNKIDWHTIALSGYFIFSVTFAIFWSKNFTSFTDKKGDEYFYYIGYNIVLSLLFFLLFAVVRKKIRQIILILIPVLSVIPSVILTLVIEAGFTKRSTTVSDLLTYGIVYPSINLLVYLFFKAKLFKAS